MRVDFYQLTRDPAESVVPLLARNTLKAGERLLVASADEAQRGRIGDALWAVKGDFLANGEAGGAHDARQPILLSAGTAPANGARFLVLADGLWRDPPAETARVFYLFGDASLQGARDCWRMLDQREGVERHFWKQQDGRWTEGP
mgnify:CR=1 FL=1